MLPGRLEKPLLLNFRKNVAGSSASIFVMLNLDLRQIKRLKRINIVINLLPRGTLLQ